MATPAPKYKPNLKITSSWGLLMIGIIAAIVVLLVLELPQDWRSFENEGFLGTGASLMSDITLLAYIFLLVPLMLFGFAFAVRKQFVPNHQVVMTTILLLNWGLIAFIMGVRFS